MKNYMQSLLKNEKVIMSTLQYFYSKADVTPKESVPLAGYANRSGTSKEVHRPLSSRCLVLRRDEITVCLIVNDFMEVPPEIVQEIRNEISRQTGVNYDGIIITSIHTHSAPLLEYSAGEATKRYIQFAIGRITENAVETILKRNLFDAGEIKIGRGRCEIGANRKLIIPEKGPAYRISDPQRIRDEEVMILQILDENGAHPVTLFNYACHPVTLGFNSLFVSPDFPGKAREIVETAFGGNAIFLNGAAANINPLTEKHTDPKKADEYGEKLGNAVVRTVLQKVTSEIDLNYLTKKIEVPYRDQNIILDFIKNEVKRKSRQITEFYHWEADLRRWADKITALLECGNMQNFFRFENTALKLGPAPFFFTQGELFVEYQLALKKQFPAYPLFCVGYTHGEGAYIPTAKNFAKNGYETDQAYIYQGLPSPFTKDIEEIYMRESVNLIKNVLELRKG